MINKKIILVSRPPQIPEALNILYKYFVVKINNDHNFSKDSFYRQIKDANGLICTGKDIIDKELLNNAPHLKAIAIPGAGYNNIDVGEATKRGIAVTNTPDELTETVADFTFGLILSVARRIAEANYILKNRHPLKWEGLYLPATDLHKKTLGIIGFGRIGNAVSKRAKAFKMKVMYNKTNRFKYDYEKELNIEYKELENLIEEADFISVHCSLNKTSFHLLTESHFNMMKPTAFLINTSRGAVVDENALIKALKTKQIAGAALDVFENEPNIPEELLNAHNVVITPHIGSGTYETRKAMVEKCCKNISMVLKGEKPHDLINAPWVPRYPK